jgi:hypothetical protein
MSRYELQELEQIMREQQEEENGEGRSRRRARVL